MPKISIIMPVHNEEKHILVAIDSILTQTFQNFEIIIVNDASTDKTKKIVEEIIKDNKKIKLINHKTNKHRAAALNTGIKHAEGEYICFLDGDDIYTKNKLQKQTEFLDQNPEIDLVYSNMIRFNEDGNFPPEEAIEFKRDPKEILINASKRQDLGKIKPHQLINENKIKAIIPGCSIMIKKSVFEKIKLDESLKAAQDYDLWFQIIGAGFKIKKLPFLSYKYRVTKGHLGKTPSKRRKESIKKINLKLKKGKYFK